MQRQVDRTAAAPDLGASQARAGQAGLTALGLVVLGDLLFWHRPLGMSLVLFAWAVFLAVALRRRRMPFGAVLVLGVGSFPVLEYAQVLSLGFLIAGLLIAIAWLFTAERTSPLALATRIAADFPTAAIRDLRAISQATARADMQRWGRGAVSAWAFPVVGAAVLAVLLLEANPILQNAAAGLSRLEPDWMMIILRALFWTALALLVWPLLRHPPERKGSGGTPSLSVALPKGTVLRALVLFNLVLAVQVVLDGLVFLGGGALPEGLTYAEYARRGAFPLFGATLLGCAFALFAQRQLAESQWMRPFLFLWLMQNVLMAAGAGFRLSMYVEAYGLTYLRLHAGIGMIMVAVSLTLIAVQVWRERSGRWLVLRGGIFAMGLLYAASFVNFADLIARQNIARGGDVDWDYLIYELPPTARATIAGEFCTDSRHCNPRVVNNQAIEDWREWGFRRWRVDRRMAALNGTEPQT